MVSKFNALKPANYNFSELPLKTLSKHKVLDDLAIIKVERPLEIGFKAGQYAELFCRDFEPRPISIASSPLDDYFEFHVKANGSGGFADFLVHEFDAMDQLKISKITGHACYVEECTKHICVLGGGLGITPLLSILSYALKQDVVRRFQAIWGLRSPADHYVSDRFELIEDDPRVEFIRHFDDQEGESFLKKLPDYLKMDPAQTRIYIGSGPELAQEAARKLLAMGFAADHVHSDHLLDHL